MKLSPYQTRMKEIAAGLNHSNTDPRHIEAWIRLDRDCLDSLSAGQFTRQVKIALLCIVATGKDQSETLAASYGL